MEKLTEKGGVVRVFYALLTLAVSIGIAFFVYQNVFTENSKYPFKLGLDLAGGSQLVYEADVSGVNPAEVDELMDVLRQVIERRINVFGVSEPVVQVERSSFVTGEPKQRLVVELPGVTDVNQAVAEIGRTPLLEFKLVDEEAAAEAALLESIEMEGATVTAAGGEAEPYVDTGLTGRYLVSSQLQFVGQNSGGGLSNEPVVSITWNEEGAKLFEEITAANVGRQLAIFLDGELISSPNINERISGGQAIISGGFTPDEARDLAQNLNFGALPVPIQLASTQTVGSTLGAEVLEKGMMAGTIGFGLVIVFMLLWYRLPGLVAIVSLLTYVVVMLALFQFIPVVLTAAGLAGFILTIGMAVDANVLVFERMKEEYREGKSFREAASVGFQRAWSAIRDGNVTSLLSAVILFWFGTSMVKGFALVFGIGVLTSMISALIVTRTLLLALPDKKKGEGLLAKLYETGLGKPPHQSS
ncbi:MAG: protein translocase subunit SecD [Candidatus Paceibacterota bacterium]